MRYDPVSPLLAAGDPALAWAVGRDLLDEPLEPQALWELPEVVRAWRAQRENGSWAYRGGNPQLRSTEDYSQYATYQQLLVLISKYRLDRRHPAVGNAAEFLLGFQTREGDIRGIYGSQYTPNYTGDMLGLLIAAGYKDDPRALRGIEWLLSIRQNDGGWAVPLRTVRISGGYTRAMKLAAPLQPDRTRPSSHLITGIALRALAAHPRYRHRPEARRAARLLASRFFEADRYVDRRDRSYWTKLAFPYRWTDLASSLEVIALAGLAPEDTDVARGLRWLAVHQRPNGLWPSGYPKTKDPLVNHWVTFAVARVFKRFYGRRALWVERRASPLMRSA
jgi:hypothetical protein